MIAIKTHFFLSVPTTMWCVAGKKTEQTVFCLPKFTIPDDKELVVEMNEKEGGRHQSFVVENSDLVRALTINELSVK